MTKNFLTYVILSFLPICMSAGMARAEILEGMWFTCEFATDRHAPDDACAMFDDEGFQIVAGVLYYVRNMRSKETACRGKKKGQCFLASTPEIYVQMRKIGPIGLKHDRLFVRYMGCEQIYTLHKGEDFVTVMPAEKTCFWTRDKYFYVARYKGKVLG